MEYLEVASLPPGNNVCTWYMDNLSKEMGQLDLDCLFLHFDEALYSKLMMIKWLNEGLYDHLFPLLGGSHSCKIKNLHKNMIYLE